MLKTTLTKAKEYLLLLIDMVEEYEVDSSKYRSNKKGRNKIVEILAKSCNLPKFKSKNLFKSKNSIKI